MPEMSWSKARAACWRSAPCQRHMTERGWPECRDIATEADARQLVRGCYFGPLGERSFGANRGTDYNAGIADKAAYYREANEQMLV